ncbi:MAG: hypothetical protein AMXMBFR7_07350 [Planctomycetota bacterium]
MPSNRKLPVILSLGAAALCGPWAWGGEAEGRLVASAPSTPIAPVYDRAPRERTPAVQPLSAAPAVREPFPEPMWGQVSAGQVNVRTGPSTDYGILVTLSGGDYIHAYARQGAWLEIDWPEASPAWISKAFVDTDGTVTGDRVRIRARGTLQAPVLREAQRGERVRVLGEAGDWLKIAPPESARAYIHAKYTVLGVQGPASSSPAAAPAPMASAAPIQVLPPVEPVAAPVNQPPHLNLTESAVAALPPIDEPAPAAALPAQPEPAEPAVAALESAVPVVEAPVARIEPSPAPSAIPDAPASLAVARAAAPEVVPASEPALVPDPADPVNLVETATTVPAPAPSAEVAPAAPPEPAIAAAPAPEPQAAPAPVVEASAPLSAPVRPRPARDVDPVFGERLPKPRDVAPEEEANWNAAAVEPDAKPDPSLYAEPAEGEREGGLIQKVQGAASTVGSAFKSAGHEVAEWTTGTVSNVTPVVTENVKKGAGVVAESGTSAGQTVAGGVTSGYTKTKELVIGTPKRANPDGPEAPVAAQSAETVRTASGTLERMPLDAASGASFKLVKDGATTWFLIPEPGVQLEGYAGRRIGVVGSSEAVPSSGARVMKVSSAFTMD